MLCVIPHPLHSGHPASGYDLAIVIFKDGKHVSGAYTAAYKEAFPLRNGLLIDSYRSWATPDQLPKDIMLDDFGG